MCLIANKLGWNGKPACEVISNIKQMVLNQQSLELDTVGECDDEEETLLSIALWNADKIYSTQYVRDYQDLVMWQAECFAESIHVAWADFTDRLIWESVRPYLMAEQYDYEEELREEAQKAFEQTLPDALIAYIMLRDDIAEDYEYEDYTHKMEDEYYECAMREIAYYNHARQMGWE